MMTLRIVLLVLKNLQYFSSKCAFVRPLEAVLGPSVTEKFRKGFCVKTGAAVGFGDPIYRAKVVPSGAVMPGLGMKVDLGFTFSFRDLHGEDFGEFLNRIDAEEVNTSSD